MSQNIKNLHKAEKFFHNTDYLNAGPLYKKIIDLVPTNSLVRNRLGVCYLEVGQFEHAEAVFSYGLELDPADFEMHFNLGQVFQSQQKYKKALYHYKKCTELRKSSAQAWFRVGTVYQGLNDLSNAIFSIQEALKIDPDFPEALNELGLILQRAKFNDDARNLFEKAVELDPNNVPALINLGTLFANKEHFNPKSAEKLLKKAAELHPGMRQAVFNNLGNLYFHLRRYREAIKQYEQAISLNPKQPKAQSNRLFAMVTSGLYEMEKYLNAAKEAGQHFRTLNDDFQLFTHTEKPDAKTNLGFVSGDIKNHPVAYFLLSLLSSITPQKYNIFLFDNTNITRTSKSALRLKPYISSWHDISMLNDEQATMFIREKNIDVLIDLSGHTAGNRLGIFANRAAPIQFTWLGYNASTGIEEMDYILLDKYVGPESRSSHFSESILRMPHSYICFSPPDVELPVGETPALKNQFISYGCLNNASKVNAKLINIWAEILRLSENSRLILGGNHYNDDVGLEMKNKFKSLGINMSRITVLNRMQDHSEFLRAYNDIDIALDTFPYNGVTTTCEALWMGVPVITKKGDSFLSSVGETIIKNASQDKFCGCTEADYVDIAVKTASNIKKLNKSRIERRQKVLDSPVFNNRIFSNDFEKIIEQLVSRLRELSY